MTSSWSASTRSASCSGVIPKLLRTVGVAPCCSSSRCSRTNPVFVSIKAHSRKSLWHRERNGLQFALHMAHAPTVLHGGELFSLANQLG